MKAKARKKAKDKKPRKPPRRCSHCGGTKDLSFAPDPYSSDVHNDDTPVWECGDCREQSAADV